MGSLHLVFFMKVTLNAQIVREKADKEQGALNWSIQDKADRVQKEPTRLDDLSIKWQIKFRAKNSDLRENKAVFALS